jgi:hypothetical protein
LFRDFFRIGFGAFDLMIFQHMSVIFTIFPLLLTSVAETEPELQGAASFGGPRAGAGAAIVCGSGCDGSRSKLDAQHGWIIKNVLNCTFAKYRDCTLYKFVNLNVLFYNTYSRVGAARAKVFTRSQSRKK